MSDAGLEIYSESGNLQVTSYSGISMAMSTYGSLALMPSSTPTPLPMVEATFTITGQYPVLAYLASVPVNVMRVSASGSSFTYTVRARSGSAVSFDYWVFDTTEYSIKEPGTAGLQVYNSLGIPTFDSGAWPMVIVGGSTVPVPGRDPPDDGVTAPHDFTRLYTIPVPSGKKYAIVQTTPSYTYQNYYEISDLEIPGVPGSGTYKYVTDSYYTAAGKDNLGNLVLGVDRYEYWETYVESAGTDMYTTSGQSRHVVIDVTGYPSGTGVTPGELTISVNSYNRSVTTGGASVISTSTTPSVTLTVSGGTAPYSYFWYKTEGPDLITATGGNNTSSTFSTTTLNQPQSTTRTSEWRCRVTSNNGIISYSDPITFTHIASPYSNHVNSWSTWPNVTASGNSNHLFINDLPWVTITGPSVGVTLRFQISNLTGNLSAIGMYVEKNGSAFSNIRPDLYPSGYIDVPVVAGNTVRVWTDGQTLQGAKSGSYKLTVYNMTAAGTPILSESVFAFNTDMDNDYNRIATWTTPNQVRTSTAEYLGTNVTDKVLSGIVSGSRTIRVTMSSVSHNMDAVGFYIFKNGAQAAFSSSWTNGGYLEASFNNGDAFGVYMDAVTYNGSRSGAFITTVTDQTDTSGGSPRVLSSWSNSIVVDSDNSSLIDYTPNAFTMTPTHINSTAEYASAGTNTVTLAGFNQTITVRAIVDQISGNLSAASFFLYKNGSATQSTNFIASGNGTYVDITYVVGNTIRLDYDVMTFAGIKTGSFRLRLLNQSDGGTQLASFTVNATVDSDNSTDVTPNALGFISQTQSSTNEYLMLSSGWKTVNGIGAPINIRVRVAAITGNIATHMRGVWVWRNDGYNQFIPWNIGDYVDTTFTNGQQIAINVDANTDNGTKTGSVTLEVINLSDGNALLNTITLTFTVDSDNSSAPADYTLDGFSPSSGSVTTNSMSTTFGTSTYYVSGINRTVSLRYRITSVFKGGTGTYIDNADAGLWHNGVNVAWFGGLTAGATMTVDVVNGDSLGLACWCGIDVGNGSAETTAYIAVDNLSTGVNNIGSFSMSYTIDADGNGS